MAETLEELTYNYEDEGTLVMQAPPRAMAEVEQAPPERQRGPAKAPNQQDAEIDALEKKLRILNASLVKRTTREVDSERG